MRPSRTHTHTHTHTHTQFCFIPIGDWNAKEGIKEIPGVTGKFGLEVQNEQWQRLTEFCQEIALIIRNTHSQQKTRDDLTHRDHQIVNIEIKLITFFVAYFDKTWSKNKTWS